MTLADRPLFKHQCEWCRFLGATLQGKKRFELYYCQAQEFGPTVLARFGDRPDSYESGLQIAQQLVGVIPSHPLVKALKLAMDAGFV